VVAGGRRAARLSRGGRGRFRPAGHKRPAERVSIVVQVRVAPEEEAVDGLVNEFCADGLGVFHHLADEGVRAAAIV